MNNLPNDKNSRAIQCSFLGFSKNHGAGVLPPEIYGYIRVKNIGESDAIIRYADQELADGVYISPGETEYFFIEKGRQLEVVSGSLNIMY